MPALLVIPKSVQLVVPEDLNGASIDVLVVSRLARELTIDSEYDRHLIDVSPVENNQTAPMRFIIRPLIYPEGSTISNVRFIADGVEESANLSVRLIPQ